MHLADLPHEEALADLDHRRADHAHAPHPDGDAVEHVVVLHERTAVAEVRLERGAVGRPVGRFDASDAPVPDDDVERAQRVVQRTELHPRAVRRGRRDAGDRLPVVAAEVHEPKLPSVEPRVQLADPRAALGPHERAPLPLVTHEVRLA